MTGLKAMKYWIITKNDVFSNQIKEQIISKLHHSLDEICPDVIVAIGGDGTFIRAVHQYPNAIIFGLHTGNLGFYTNYTIETLEQLIEDLNEEKYKMDSLDLLQCKINSKDREFVDFAINEFTIIMSPKTLTLNVFIDQEQLETFRGTGLCISTPYGSTAYNKSLHGAILDPKVKALQLTEIGGINSNAYRTISSPMIISCDREIKLEAVWQEEVCITLDNRAYPIHDFESATISLALQKIKIGYHTMPNFIQRIKRTFL